MELIEREALRRELLSLTYYGDGDYYIGREAERDAVIDHLNEQPTIDPIRAAGGCRCGECAYYCADAGECAVYGARRSDYFCSVGEIDEESEPREAQNDG